MLPWIGAAARVVVVSVATFVVFLLGALLAVAGVATVLPGWAATAIESESMQPAIDPGDVVILRSTARRPPTIGSVVRFPTDDDRGAIVHRIVAVDEGADAWVTRGDANRSDDHVVVPTGSVDGVATALVADVGHPVLWLHQRQLVLVAAAAAAGVALVVVAAAPIGRPPSAERLCPGPLTSHRIGGGAAAPAPLFPLSIEAPALQSRQGPG